eukprot:TRINITY_DN15668_c0_g1_i2.p1 TRINITY_DN15668_c0_g1~~TRINITY_DN15668_c0_g1_i2.p1  ORF type:complete len:425 (+),score=84.87 TRINITY_DN15668_c0_g1_i2:66-1340(+)
MVSTTQRSLLVGGVPLEEGGIEEPAGGFVDEQQLLGAAREALLAEIRDHRSYDRPPVRRAGEPGADRETLVAFFTARDPAKLDMVDSILERFTGREPTMYEGLVQQYGLWRANPHRDSIIKYYAIHNPSRICAVDVLLDLYHGREEQLMFLLLNKYHPTCPLRLWVKYWDEASGHHYYYDRVTQQVQWERPDAGYVVDPDGTGLTKLSPRSRAPATWFTADPPALGSDLSVAALAAFPTADSGKPSPPPVRWSTDQYGSPPRRVSHSPARTPRVPVDLFPVDVPAAYPADLPVSPVSVRAQQPQQAGLAAHLRRCRSSSPGSALSAPQPPPLQEPPPPSQCAPPSPRSRSGDVANEVCLCEECHAVCQGFDALATHKEQAGHGAWHKCPVGPCPYQFPNQHSLLLHRLQCHPQSGNPVPQGQVG